MRWRHNVARVAGVLGVLLVVMVVAGAGFLWSLPGVGDAKTRVARIDASHGVVPRSGPPPAKLAAAVVAVEDEHFYSNVIVDVVAGAVRAGLATLQTSGDPGGSTITQQLAKLLYSPGSGFTGTLKEIGLGVKLSLRYSKPDILMMYLNVAYFGNDDWGAAAAAEGYFGVRPEALDWAEAAMLAGLPQAPSSYDPLQHLAVAKLRQRHVLDRLVETGALSTQRADAAFSETLPFRSP